MVEKEKKSSHFLEMSFFKLLVSKCFCKDNRTIITISTSTDVSLRLLISASRVRSALLGKNGNIQETYSKIKPHVFSESSLFFHHHQHTHNYTLQHTHVHPLLKVDLVVSGNQWG